MQRETIGPKTPPAGAPDERTLYQRALAAPDLHALLRDARTAHAPVVLAINDPHRATPTRTVLEHLAAACQNLPDAPPFRVVVATGTHTFAEEERTRFEGDVLPPGLDVEKVAWHDARAADLVQVGAARFHPWIAGQQFLLGVGSVEPHYFAGLTGAHKTLTIGVLARDDIERNHAGALDPAADVLRLAGNPVYDGVARLVSDLRSAGKRMLAINVVSIEGRTIAVDAGAPLHSLAALRSAVEAAYVHELDSAADVVHLQVPRPLGRNLYQADKALKNNGAAVRDGGGIVLEAECYEGIGPDAFLDLLREAPTSKAARERVEQRGYRLGDHKGVKLRGLTDPAGRGVRIALVAAPDAPLSDADISACGMRRWTSVAEAEAWLAEAIGRPCERILRIEDAGNVTTRVRR